MQKFGYFIHLELPGYVSKAFEMKINIVGCHYVIHSVLF